MVQLNGEDFTLSMFRGLGHSTILDAGYGRPAEPLFPDRIFAQMLVEIEAAEGAGAAGAAALAATEAARDTTLIYKNDASASKDAAAISAAIAAAAATASQLPNFTTTGTGSAYVVTPGSPTPPATDDFAMRINVHTTNGASPTLNYGGEGALELVDGLNVSNTGAFRSLGASELYAGQNLLVVKETRVSPNKWVIIGGLPLIKLAQDMNAAGFNITNIRGYQGGFCVDGTLANGLYARRFYFANATRLYNIKVGVSTGTIDVVFNKNGSTDIGFGAGSTTVSVTSTLTAKAVNHTGNAYIDFAQGDFIQFTFSNNSSASNFLAITDKRENYS